jgi:hypothetical protein
MRLQQASAERRFALSGADQYQYLNDSPADHNPPHPASGRQLDEYFLSVSLSELLLSLSHGECLAGWSPGLPKGSYPLATCSGILGR